MPQYFPKNRKRRLIFNDDSDQQYRTGSYPYQVLDDESFLNARTTHTFDTHVDTYVWCVGNGCDPPWVSTDRLWPTLGSHARANELIVNGCHEHGMEVWASLRMNDIHDSFHKNLDEAADPLKAQHPEYLISSESDRKLPQEFLICLQVLRPLRTAKLVKFYLM